MIYKLIVSQGDLARQMLATARRIAGEMPEFRALALDWDDSFESAQRKIGNALREMGAEEGQPVLILTDIYGGTPYNVAATFCRPGEIETVTGVNLPMIVRLGCRANGLLSLHDLASWIEQKGRRSICTTQGGACADEDSKAECGVDDRA
jgi:PTS system mannose-specific IIA component